MNRQQQDARIMFIMFFILLAVCIVGTMLLSGCRTYYVYQYGLGDNEILVDAEVEKEINPSVKASLK